MDFHITGIGIIAIDDFLYVSSYPEPDRKALVLQKRRGFGGLVGTALAAAAAVYASRRSGWDFLPIREDVAEILHTT